MFNNQPNFSKKEIAMSGISQRVATEAQGLDALIHKMSDEDFEFFHHFGRDKPSGHRQPYAAYIDRVFYIYQAQGRDRMNIQRPPKIEAIVRVSDLQLTRHRGLEIELLNETTNEIQIVGSVPARAFGFPVFVQAPNSTALRRNLISRPNQQDTWEVSVGLFIKT